VTSVPARVGTLEWAEQTGGRLRSADRVRLLTQGLIFQTRELAALLGLRPRRLTDLDLGRIRIPDTSAAKEAEGVCSQQRPRYLINHCYRTFMWASLLAAHERRHYDEEMLYIASLLHDTGLSQATSPPVGPTCFTLVGAEHVRACSRANGVGEERWRQAAGAITLHMNLRVTPDDGVESYLLTFGTQLDAIGAGYRRIPPATRARVLDRYPRDAGIKEGFSALFKEQARHHRGSRSRFYWRYLGLGWRLRHAPFDD
jgi:hypothetical protein